MLKSVKSNGFSLLEMIISVGVLTTVVVGMTAMITGMQKDTQALTDRLAGVEVQRSILSSFTSEICTFVFTDASQSTNRSTNIFNSTALNSVNITLQNLPAKASASALKIVTVNEKASTISQNLVVSSIRLTNLSGSGDEFTGQIQVSFNIPGSTRVPVPATAAVMVYTDSASPANAKQITSCSTIGAGGGGGSSVWDASGSNIYFSSGYVGIGTSTPRAMLDVSSGQIVGSYYPGSSATINWHNGNIQTTSVAPGTVTLNNMKDGATYTLVFTNSAGGMYRLSSADVSTWRCSPNCPSGDLLVDASSQTVVSIVKTGSTAYVSWIRGF